MKQDVKKSILRRGKAAITKKSVLYSKLTGAEFFIRMEREQGNKIKKALHDLAATKSRSLE